MNHPTSKKQTQACIQGLGYYVPQRVLSNSDLEKIVETSDEWITTRTGISERRMAEGQTTSDLAFEASRKALEEAGIEPGELTHILVATFTPDSYIPNCASTLQHKLGNTTAMCTDIGAACSGFLYTLETARSFLQLHPEAKILVACSEVVTSRVNFQDRTTCVLFGDGAGAVVMANPHPNRPCIAGIGDIMLRADGSLGDLLTVTGGGSALPPKLGEPVTEDYFVYMEGREVFKHAVRSMESVTRDLLARNGLDMDSIDLFIPHQANMRIVDYLAKKLAISREKLYINVDRFGNTSAASIPIALAEARENNILQPGMKVGLTTFGGGFTWGSAFLQF